MGALVYCSLSVLCTFVSVRYQIRVPVKNHNMCLSKLDTLMHKTHIKVLLVLRYKGSTCMCRSILSLSKIAHQMWCDHPFSQRNRTTGVGVGGDKEFGVRELDKIGKNGGGDR